MPLSTEVVIIGGGVIGCSLAYHLRKRGVDGVCECVQKIPLRLAGRRVRACDLETANGDTIDALVDIGWLNGAAIQCGRRRDRLAAVSAASAARR